MVSSTSSILLFCIIPIILRLSTAQICQVQCWVLLGYLWARLTHMVYVLGYCRGDLSEESCVNCVNSSSQAIMKNCPNKIAAMSFGDKYQCFVGCSDKNVSMVMGMYPYIILSNTANISINYVNEFDQALLSLAISLVEKASLSPPRSKFATGKNNFTKYENIYALMECIPSIALDGCRDCLQQLVDDYQTCCMRRKGVVIVGPNCMFQYEMYPFFEVTSDPSPPPLPPPVSSASLPPPTNKTINEGMPVSPWCVKPIQTSFINIFPRRK
ncbi:hypothetical protein Acr_18g0004670 [Actinidia rufa]|uniref:Gnk2-homologous domain-containing protein n=1 Tax=Actinidia rufa TaxID=165716 RepID=A0A7J0G6A2_9ERIC|nr:hypothetical protein Acr_18g0004670 [Actinidia rufa]